jgi:hypothetical protein
MNNTVCLCGSTKFLDAFNKANIELTKRGLTVITISMCLPRNEQDNQEDEALKELLDLVHLNKIMKADAVFIVGTGYFGRSTAREILWAEMHGKPVIRQDECNSWDNAATRLRIGSYGTDIFPKAREKLGLPLATYENI